MYSMSQALNSNFDKQMEVLDQGLKATNGHLKIKEHMATILMQWDESKGNKSVYSNNVKTAESILIEILSVKLSEPALFFLAIIEHKYKGDHLKARRYLYMILNINPSRYTELMNFVCKFETTVKG